MGTMSTTGAQGADTQGARQTRSTWQRRAVEDQLAAVDDFRSAQDVHEMLRAAGERVGLATVYRTLQTMVESGQVDVLRNDAGESVYRRCLTEQHHHHLVCRRCGRTVEIEGPAVERWADAVAAEHGYDDVRHTIELFGVCAPCRQQG